MILATFKNAEKRDVLKACYLFAFFFLVIGAFWTLKPMRTSGVVKSFGTEYYPIFKQAFIFVAPFLVGLLAFLSRTLVRERLVYLFCGVFSLLSFVFWGIFTFQPGPAADACFFFFVDAYISIMVFLFFSYMNGVYSSGEARKYFGFVGLGGLLGGTFGSIISGWGSKIFEHHIVLFMSVFLAGVCFTVSRLKPLCQTPAPAPTPKKAPSTQPTPRFAGLSTLFHSKYLLALAAIVGIYEIASTIVDFQFTDSANGQFSDRYALSGYIGKVFTWGMAGSVAVQVFVTTYMNQRKTIVYGLLFLPVCMLMGSVGFIFFPVLMVISLAIGSEASFAYSIQQTTREILYVPLSKVARFQSKAVIDIFVIRGAKMIGGGLAVFYALYMINHGFTSRFLMVTNIFLISLWLWATYSVSRAFDAKVREKEVLPKTNRFAKTG